MLVALERSCTYSQWRTVQGGGGRFPPRGPACKGAHPNALLNALSGPRKCGCHPELHAQRDRAASPEPSGERFPYRICRCPVGLMGFSRGRMTWRGEGRGQGRQGRIRGGARIFVKGGGGGAGTGQGR